jgi:hypothetical protein
MECQQSLQLNNGDNARLQKLELQMFINHISMLAVLVVHLLAPCAVLLRVLMLMLYVKQQLAVHVIKLSVQHQQKYYMMHAK